MLRIASILLVLSAGIITAAPVPKVKVKDADTLLGKWVIVELSHSGMGAQEGYQDAVVTLDKDTMAVKAPTKPDSDERMGYKLDQDKKHIDLRPNEGAGANVELQGIYELDGDTLIIAIPIGGKGERPAEVKPGPGIAYLKLRRIKEEKK